MRSAAAALVRIARRDRDGRRPIPSHQCRAEPDRSGAEHEHLCVGLHPGALDAPHGDGQRLGERRGDRVDPVGDGGEVLDRRVDQLGQAAVAPEADARPCPATEVGPTGAAERARSAGDVGRHRVPHVGEARRTVDDDAGQLVSRRGAERPAAGGRARRGGRIRRCRTPRRAGAPTRSGAGRAPRRRSRAPHRSRWRAARAHRRPIGGGPPPACDHGPGTQHRSPE